MRSMLRTFALAGVFSLTATVSRGDSEIVIAIRYLQSKGTSHAHLYLYREDGKLLRQLTDDNSGQDSDPIFAPDGEAIAFTREKPNDAREFWSVDPRAKELKKLDKAPAWYTARKSLPAPADTEEEGSSSSASTSQGPASPPPATEAQQESAASESIQPAEHQSVTALDAVADAEDRPPEIIKVPDGSGEIFWRKGKDEDASEESLNWVMWFRDLKSGQETEIGRLPAFPSFEPLHIGEGKDPQFRSLPSDDSLGRVKMDVGKNA